MAEFLVVFVVTFLVISGVALALILGRTPVYQPDAEKIQSILTRMLEGQLDEAEWDFFINMPIHHDTSLEALRLKCQEATEQYSLRARAKKARLKEPGLIRLRFLLNQIERQGAKTF